MLVAWHILVKYAGSPDPWTTSQVHRLNSFNGEFPSMVQRVQNNMTGLPADIRQCMCVINRGVIIPLQMHSVDQSVGQVARMLLTSAKCFGYASWLLWYCLA